MVRGRNLRLPSSSDEDEETPQPQPSNPNPNPNSNFNPSSPPPSPPVEISDEEPAAADFYDVPDDFSDPSPPNFNPNPNSNVEPIDQLLQRSGLRLRREWLDSCVSELERSELGFDRLDFNEKAKLCFANFLASDMNYCGGGILPANVSGMHQVELEGPFVLQVDEVINICCPLRERYHNASAGFKRCLKLSITDGIQRVFGMEYRPIRDLDVVGPAGLKIMVRNIHIRRGLLMLVPEAMEVLGGQAEVLEEARKSLVHEIDKPPRGKRKRSNDTLPLAKRASLAAWPSSTVDNGARQLNNLVPQSSNNSQPTAQAAPFTCSISVTEARVIDGFDVPDVGGITTVERTAQRINESTTQEFIAPNLSDHFVDERSTSNRRETIAATFASSGTSEASTVQEHADFVIGSKTIMEEQTAQGLKDITANGFVAHVPENILEEPTASSRLGIHPDTVMETPPHAGNTNALDMEEEVGEVEHPLILTGDREIPFTYLACLLAKWATRKDQTPSIQGKIKCTLTGVKGFEFKHRSTYKLNVYVDDGSLISEVVIDHHVVEKAIGHSPEEVTAALSSDDKKRVTDMKETLKKFQLFLTKFEGTILVEINENSSFPVALEMNQGCSTSDAWMLLRRLKKFSAPKKASRSHSSPIDLSP